MELPSLATGVVPLGGGEFVEGGRRGDRRIDETVLWQHAAKGHDAGNGPARGAELYPATTAMERALLLGGVYAARRIPAGHQTRESLGPFAASGGGRRSPVDNTGGGGFMATAQIQTCYRIEATSYFTQS